MAINKVKEMSKKRAVLLVLLAEAVIYLVLLVGLPAFENAVLCSTAYGETVTFTAPLILYFMPGLIGLLLIMVILRHKREVRDA